MRLELISVLEQVVIQHKNITLMLNIELGAFVHLKLHFSIFYLRSNCQETRTLYVKLNLKHILSKTLFFLYFPNSSIKNYDNCILKQRISIFYFICPLIAMKLTVYIII